MQTKKFTRFVLKIKQNDKIIINIIMRTFAKENNEQLTGFMYAILPSNTMTITFFTDIYFIIRLQF